MHYRVKVRSRHPSHDVLRYKLPRMPFKSVVRLGSVTIIGDEVSFGGDRVEINTVSSIENSSDKLLMKQAFESAGVVTAPWSRLDELNDEVETWFNETWFNNGRKAIVKPRFGSRGSGLRLISSYDELLLLSRRPNSHNYIVERYIPYNREYRLHVTKRGCFYTCRKVLREETPPERRFFRNDSNSNWIVEDNPMFNRPSTWPEIQDECVKALNAVGLDIGACDVRVQGKEKEDPKFFVVEINSAPSFGSLTAVHYLAKIPEVLTLKKFYEQ